MPKEKKILILGSGGREHVFAWKLSRETSKENLWVAPGNAGIAAVASIVEIAVTDFVAISKFCLEKQIDILIPGGEEPLVAGIRDYFEADEKLRHIFVFGPSKSGAQIEGSKAFSKEFMARNNIPTAAYRAFEATELEKARTFLESLTPPYVLKADGLAAGKGVLILNNLEEAKKELESMLLNSKFGKASQKVVIEEFLDGIEFSVFVITDGAGFVVLPEAKDYKRIGEGDTGLNTGGMGAVSPVPFVGTELMYKVVQKIVKPTIAGLALERLKYRGFIFFGLIKVGDEPLVIEYNARMGDPETEVVFPRIKTKFLEMIEATKNKSLERLKLEIDPQTCVTVFTVSGGYPGKFEKGKIIELGSDESALIFHAGTTLNAEGELITNGGRVLALSSFGPGIEQAAAKSYEALKHIRFEKMYYRRDIGQDIISLKSK
jgi:phosphoribosylamine--glycine ligase